MPVPLRERKLDWLLLAFFILNLGFITYFIDIEQIIIADPAHFTYPLWPPAYFVDMVHQYGAQYDPLLLARPPFWRATIWIDAVFFGPFYIFAIYALIKAREWIRTPVFIWAGMMMSNVIIILFEERWGLYATPAWPHVLLLNLPWLLMPIVAILRFSRRGFSR